MWVMGDHRLISYDSRGHGPVPAADITGRVFETSHGSSRISFTTPATFVADGLAPPDHRKPLPLILLGGAVILAVVELVLGVLGVTRWAIKRNRAHRQMLAYGQVP
jgi:hypothetical protein